MLTVDLLDLFLIDQVRWNRAYEACNLSELLHHLTVS